MTEREKQRRLKQSLTERAKRVKFKDIKEALRKEAEAKGCPLKNSTVYSDIRGRTEYTTLLDDGPFTDT